MESFQNEITIEKYPMQVSIKGTEKILKQMKNCVCKIYTDEGSKTGTGFFSKIQGPDKIFINVLITNNHVLSEENLILGKTIKLSLNDEKEFKEILLNNLRYIYTNKSLDITFIEIKEEDEIYDFLDIDENINQSEKFYKELFFRKGIYILHYPSGIKIMVSYGILNDISEKEIKHTCSTEDGSSGSPIISLKNFKVIGIHKGHPKSFSFNKGTFIKDAIIEFNKFIEERKKIYFKRRYIKNKFKKKNTIDENQKESMLNFNTKYKNSHEDFYCKKGNEKIINRNIVKSNTIYNSNNKYKNRKSKEKRNDIYKSTEFTTEEDNTNNSYAQFPKKIKDNKIQNYNYNEKKNKSSNTSPTNFISRVNMPERNKYIKRDISKNLNDKYIISPEQNYNLKYKRLFFKQLKLISNKKSKDNYERSTTHF